MARFDIYMSNCPQKNVFVNQRWLELFVEQARTLENKSHRKEEEGGRARQGSGAGGRRPLPNEYSVVVSRISCRQFKCLLLSGNGE